MAEPKPSEVWKFLVWILVVSILVVALILGVVRDLGVLDQLASVLSGVVIVGAVVARWGRPVPPEVTKFVSRSWVEMAELVLFFLATVGLLRLPSSFARHSGLWWLTKFTAALCIVALMAALTSIIWPPSARLSRWFAGTGVMVLLLAVGLAFASRLPAPELTNCGAAQIAVDTRLRAQVSSALVAYQAVASDECADSLTVEDAADDLHERLLTTDTPIAAVVTADPAVLKGLGGSWTNLGVLPDPRTGWQTIGLDLASVFLADGERRARESVELSELTQLDVGRFTSLDPVTVTVMARAASLWTPRVEREVEEELTGQPCPARVVLPTRWTRACAAVKALTPVPVVDSDDNRVGAPVLGIHLEVVNADQARPTASARSEADDFLAWLDRNPGKVQLQTLNQPIKDVLASVSAQNELIRRQTERIAVNVAVVVDASLSMGRATDRGKYGAPAPWKPTIDGVRRWVRTAAPERADRVTIVTAHTGSGPIGGRTLNPATGGFERRWPRTSPHGETALAEALTQARRTLDRQAGQGRRPLLVLVTDAINVFKEKPVRSGLLSQLQVVVVRDGNGCAAVRPWTQKRCRVADLDAQDVSTQLTALVAQTRDR